MQVLAETLDIEPGRIRFIEAQFAEFMTGSGDAATGGLDERNAALIREVHHLLFVDGMPVEAVRATLRSSLKIVAVTSGKGGVGKTTVSINLAVCLARHGLRVLLFDADMGLGNVHVLAGVEPRGTVLDVVDGRASLADVMADGPGGIKVVCGASGISRLADLDARSTAALAREITLMGRAFDVVIVDTAAGISSQVTHFLRVADDILLVATPSIASMLDAYGVIKVAREGRMKGEVRVLVNMVESNQQAEEVFGRLHACAARFLDYAPRHAGQLRKLAVVERSNQNRQPLALAEPASINARRLDDLAVRFIEDWRAGTTPVPEGVASGGAAEIVAARDGCDAVRSGASMNGRMQT